MASDKLVCAPLSSDQLRSLLNHCSACYIILCKVRVNQLLRYAHSYLEFMITIKMSLNPSPKSRVKESCLNKKH